MEPADTLAAPAQPGGKPAKIEPPPPLVKWTRHPIKWVRIKVILIIDALVLAHIGVLVVAALYYLITQTNPTVKHWWDGHVNPATLRHDIRDVGEGVLASCMAQAIVWNHFTRSHMQAGHTFREWRARYHVPVVVSALLSAFLIGAIAFSIGELVLHLAAIHSSAKAPTGSFWNRTGTIWNSSFPKKALGFIAAFIARRPLHVVYDEIQGYFVSRRATAGRPVRWFHPPVFKARYNYLIANPHQVQRYPIVLTISMTLLLTATVALAGTGYWVLTYRA